MEIVIASAYAPYVSRIGKPPAPMLAPIAADIASGDAYVLEIESLIVGIIVFRIVGDALSIENVAVPPRLQGMGIGTKLMNFAQAHARERDLREIRLFTNAKMIENVALYGRLGYERVGERIEDGYHRVYMRLALGSARPIA